MSCFSRLLAKLDSYNKVLASNKKYRVLNIGLIELGYSPTKVAKNQTELLSITQSMEIVGQHRLLVVIIRCFLGQRSQLL